MESFNVKDMINGWFIGNFEPTLLNTGEFEVALKRYKMGDFEKKHTHKIATEFTLIVEGEVEMNGMKYVKDEIIKINPQESTDFKCLTDVISLVVKIPSVKMDKYFTE
jgi:hypothetical protein